MKRPRRRQRPEHSWDRLRGTRLEVLPLPGGTVRRVAVDTDDPLAAVVSFGVHALTGDHEPGANTLRLVAVHNWNADPRELFQIPEARAWFRQLWTFGKPLLRLLSESSADTPPDDRLGLSQRDVSQLGLGWFDVYTLGMCDIQAAELVTTAEGPVWGLEAVGQRGFTREAVRAELLDMTPANPEGYTFDDAANRRVFQHNNRALVSATLERCGMPDPAVLVLSLLDPVGAKLAHEIVDAERIRATLEDCRRRDLHPGAVLAVPRELAAGVLRTFAPGAADRVAERHPEPGWHWAAFVAFNGTLLAGVGPTGMEDEL